LNETVPYCTVFSVFCKPGEAFLAKETHLFRNASVKLGDSFFTTKNTNGHEKISWDARRILADNATSMKFFRVLSGISLFKKNSVQLVFPAFGITLHRCLSDIPPA
jgi:hypothetical protein